MYLFISSLHVFRASQCSSSGDRIVLIHHLVWLVCVSDCLVCQSGGNCRLLCKPRTTQSHSAHHAPLSLTLHTMQHSVSLCTPCSTQSHSAHHTHSVLLCTPHTLSLTLHTTQHTHHNLSHVLPQYWVNYNDEIILILSTKSNSGQAQYRPPDDGLHGPKHVGVTVKKVF